MTSLRPIFMIYFVVVNFVEMHGVCLLNIRILYLFCLSRKRTAERLYNRKHKLSVAGRYVKSLTPALQHLPPFPKTFTRLLLLEFMLIY